MRPFFLYEQDNHNSRSHSNRKAISNENILIQDLNLQVILKAMAQNDRFIYNTAKSVILNSLTEINTIIYRQSILKDCINNRAVINKFYAIAAVTLNESAYYRELTQPNYARIIPMSDRVQKALGLLEILTAKLEELKSLCRSPEKTFQSEGLTAFCSQLSALLTDGFLIKVKEHISDLRSLSESGKLVIGSSFGNGMKGANNVLRKISNSPPITGPKWRLSKTCENNVINLDSISTENSAQEIKDAGLVHILRVINHFTDNILHLFEALRYETGFYVGCTNLYKVLSEIGVAVCYPVPEDTDKETLVFEGLYDLSMAVGERKRLVENGLDATGKSLLIITGANQGGKSTFLRSIGLAQMLMQCGMFAPASYFRANVCDYIFTHFTREEDANMNSGKLDEELLRMNSIIDHITPNSLLLMNESFATTTEREGSRIARDILTALYELGVKVIFVSHLFEFSDTMYNLELGKAIFLRAERSDDGCRSFRIKIDKPLHTSYGEDLFKSIIGQARQLV